MNKTMTTKTSKVICHDYIVMGRHFTIVFHDGMYCAIEDKYIDDSGCTNKHLNCSELCPGLHLNDCLERVRQKVKMEAFMADGLSRAEAMCKVFGYPCTPEMLKTLNTLMANEMRCDI